MNFDKESKSEKMGGGGGMDGGVDGGSATES